MDVRDKEFSIVQKLVGDSIIKEHLLFVDSFIYEKLSMFMPVGGNCGYAITPGHTHPAYMFVISYDSESAVYVGENKFESSPNSMFCLSPEIEHHEVQNYLPPKYCAMFIQKEFFEQSLNSYMDEPLHIEGRRVDMKSQKLDMLSKEFINEAQNTHTSKGVVLDSLSAMITHEIIRTILECNSHPVDVSDNQAVNEAIKHININYEQNITLDDLAKISKLSKSHFTKVFTLSMQVSPMEYLKTIRLQNAKKMLLSNGLSITQVSQQCGFNSPSYFTKSFKEAFNETPKEFIQRG